MSKNAKWPYSITKETLARIKELEPFEFRQYQELVNSGEIIALGRHKNNEVGDVIETKISFRKPVKIYFDEEEQAFVYLNPFYKTLRYCGKWKD